MVDSINTSGTGRISELDDQYAAQKKIVDALADADAKQVVDNLNKQQFKDANGKIIHFDNLDDWKKAVKEAQTNGAKWTYTDIRDGSTGTLEKGRFIDLYDHAFRASAALKAQQDKLQGLADQIGPLKALNEFLSTGDIESALIYVMSMRTQQLDTYIASRINEMQERNNQIKDQNAQLARLQSLPDGWKDSTGKTKEAYITETKGNVDKLNNDSQLDMIKLQDTVTKRNQVFDMMTNLMSKFAKTMDNIISHLN